MAFTSRPLLQNKLRILLQSNISSGTEQKPTEDIDETNLQLACSIIYDLLNDGVQALRNIIVAKDLTSVIFVIKISFNILGAS